MTFVIPRRLLACMSTLLWLLPFVQAYADTSAQVTETFPSTDATLGHQQSFWVRIEYQSDDTVSLWARPYLKGVAVEKAMSNASLGYEGSGEALGWFALTERGEVDEIRIRAGGGKPYKEWELARYPVQLSWSDAPAADESQPEWLQTLQATEKARYAEDAKRRAEEPVSLGAATFFSGFMLLVLALVVAGVVVPLWSVWKWRGGWRLAAAVPAALILFVVLRIVIDTANDPTSHNLWPFEILIYGTVALAIIGALKLARRWMSVES